jgi:hypothetical protein
MLSRGVGQYNHREKQGRDGLPSRPFCRASSVRPAIAPYRYGFGDGAACD